MCTFNDFDIAREKLTCAVNDVVSGYLCEVNDGARYNLVLLCLFLVE